MAKLDRKRQKIFGATGDTAQFGQIGSDAAGSPATSKDPDVIQSLAQYLAGLFSITNNLNEPPRGQDLNALYHLITRQLAYLFEAGVPEWETATEYSSLSSIVFHVGKLYISLTNGNTGNNPAASPSHWRMILDQYGHGPGPVSLAGRIAEYTGDGVPEIPDNAAGTSYVNNKGFTSVPATYLGPNSSPSSSFSGGVWTITGSAANSGYFVQVAYRPGLFIAKIRVKAGTVIAGLSTGPETFTADGKWHTVSCYMDSVAGVMYQFGSTQAIWDVEYVYIGTGAYDSKILSLSGANHLTNNGLLPVNGPYGKMLRGNGAQYAVADGPVFGTTGTIFGLFRRPSSLGVAETIASRRTANTNGFWFFFGTNNTLIMRLYTAGSFVDIASAAITPAVYYTYSVTSDGTTTRLYLNGVQVASSNTPILYGNTPLYLGASDGTTAFIQSDFTAGLDSRVWTDEEVAAWSNDPRAYDSRLAYQLSDASPLMAGAATPGTANLAAREGHVHPTDTSRAPVASPTFTGTPAAPTAAANTNTTQIATTAFVNTEIATDRPYSDTNPLMAGTAAQGSSARVSRQDHRHPTDTSRAPLASPAFTGTPTAPTAAAGTNNTQVATTEFVKSEGPYSGFTGAGDYIIPGCGDVHSVEDQTNSTSYASGLEANGFSPLTIKVPVSGTVRIRYFLKTGSTSTVYAQLYKNGSAISGTEKSAPSGAGVAHYSDILVSKGDEIKIYMRTPGSSVTAFVNSFSACSNGYGAKWTPASYVLS